MDLQENDGLRIVRAEAELDWDQAQDFGERLRAAASTPGARVVVDLSAVVFADSSTLHVLLQAQRELSRGGGRLVLAGPLGIAARRLFDLTMTAGHFEFAADTAAACRALANGSQGPVDGADRKPPEA